MIILICILLTDGCIPSQRRLHSAATQKSLNAEHKMQKKESERGVRCSNGQLEPHLLHSDVLQVQHTVLLISLYLVRLKTFISPHVKREVLS